MIAYIKKRNVGYKPKKSKVLTVNDISRLCNEAMDPDWLVVKIICIVGITGACRKEELTNITMKDVEDHKTMLLIKIPKTKIPGVERSFTVTGDFYKLCQQYLKIRSNVEIKVKNCSNRLFLRMSDGKCENRPIGINKIGELPKRIAEFLKLPDSQLYTGHCFRRTSATLLIDGGADITTLKRHTGHKSTTVAEGYINESLQNKINTGNTIVKSIDISASVSKKRPFENIDSLPSTSKKLPRMGFSHAQPATSTGKLHLNHPVIIPEAQTSKTADLSSQWAIVRTQLIPSTVYHSSENGEDTLYNHKQIV